MNSLCRYANQNCVFDIIQCKMYSMCFVSVLFVDCHSFNSSGAVVGALNQLAADMDSLSEFQRRQFDQKDSRGEALLMQRLRPFVSEGIHGVIEMSRCRECLRRNNSAKMSCRKFYGTVLQSDTTHF